MYTYRDFLQELSLSKQGDFTFYRQLCERNWPEAMQQLLLDLTNTEAAVYQQVNRLIGGEALFLPLAWPLKRRLRQDKTSFLYINPAQLLAALLQRELTKRDELRALANLLGTRAGSLWRALYEEKAVQVRKIRRFRRNHPELI